MFKKGIVFLLAVFAVAACQPKSAKVLNKTQNDQSQVQEKYFVNKFGDTIQKISKTNSEWKQILSETEFYVLRQNGTEPAFSGDLLINKEEGLYTCRACGLPLFSSRHKFDSGSGWPAFFDVLDKNALFSSPGKQPDGYATALSCAKCNSHLGHIFKDGPAPTGLRYSINAVSLDFIRSEYKK